MLQINHTCGDCGSTIDISGRIPDKCFCERCLDRAKEEAFEDGKKEGHEEGYSEGLEEGTNQN